MIIDINASIGHYAFRHLRFNTAEKLVGVMDRHGITRAVVTSSPALFYRDAHRGNEELFEETRNYRDRFINVATVNPTYAGWQSDLAEAIERWQMKAVTLVPEYHGYKLTDERGRAALARISDYGVPLLLRQRIEDGRQRHSWDRAEDLTLASVLEVATAYPKLRFILANWTGVDGDKLAGAGLKGRCLIDFARMGVVYSTVSGWRAQQEIPKLIAQLGVECIAFGSHVPFAYISPSLVKLANLQMMSAAAYEQIAWRNAATFLRLEP